MLKDNDPEHIHSIYAAHKEFILDIDRTGSRVICNPPPRDTDDDYVILTHNKEEFLDRLRGYAWELGGSLTDESNFFSVKKQRRGFIGGDTLINLIVTDDPDYYNNWVLATALAKKLNLLKKEDRIAVFQAIVEENWPEL